MPSARPPGHPHQLSRRVYRHTGLQSHQREGRRGGGAPAAQVPCRVIVGTAYGTATSRAGAGLASGADADGPL